MHRACLIHRFEGPENNFAAKDSTLWPLVVGHEREKCARISLTMDDYSDFYATLGVNPDTDWKTLRGHYKRLIGQWHPDRFSGDTASREVAEERSKQITIAYTTLGNYRREHGVLPPGKRAIVDKEAQGQRPHADPTSDRVHSDVHAETGAMRATVGEPSERRPGHWRHIALALFAAIPALYLADRYAGPRAPDDSRPSDSPERPDIATQAPAESPSREARWIWPGSTIGEVYAVQGVPTSTQGETWHYGRSQIRFAQGKVISWKQHPDSPLRIARDQPVQVQEGTFGVGSTKDEVRAIQGTPVTETETVWDYGPSRVHFNNNRVIHWEESPMQPLRVPH
jgi:curved DNA-binding protein CbpA